MANGQNDPTISVIMPNYNHGHFIGRALDSICKQDLSPFDVLVLDDCSTDNSMEIIQSFVNQYPFVRVIRYPEKSKDWQRAFCDHIRLLRGDYLHCIGADDLILPGFYRAATNALRQHPKVGVVFSNWYVINSQGEVRGQATSGVVQETYLQGEALKQQLCKPRFFEGGTASVIRMDAFLWLVDHGSIDLGPWFDSMGWSMVAWKYGAVYLPQTFGGFTVHEKGGFNDAVVADDAKSITCFEHVARFLRHPDVQTGTPQEILNALEKKVFGRFKPTALQAWLSTQGLPQAQAYFQVGQWEIAGVIYQRLTQVEPNRADGFAGLGACLVRLGRPADAEMILVRALSINGQQSGVHAYLAICYQARGQFQQALFYLQRAVELDPPSAETYFRLGETQQQLQQFRDAAIAYQRSAELLPSLDVARQRREECLAKMKGHDVGLGRMA